MDASDYFAVVCFCCCGFVTEAWCYRVLQCGGIRSSVREPQPLCNTNHTGPQAAQSHQQNSQWVHPFHAWIHAHFTPNRQTDRQTHTHTHTHAHIRTHTHTHTRARARHECTRILLQQSQIGAHEFLQKFENPRPRLQSFYTCTISFFLSFFFLPCSLSSFSLSLSVCLSLTSWKERTERESHASHAHTYTLTHTLIQMRTHRRRYCHVTQKLYLCCL